MNQGSVTEYRGDRYTLLIGARAVVLVQQSAGWCRLCTKRNAGRSRPVYQTDNVWYVVVSTAVKKKVKVAADHRERARERGSMMLFVCGLTVAGCAACGRSL